MRAGLATSKMTSNLTGQNKLKDADKYGSELIGRFFFCWVRHANSSQIPVYPATLQTIRPSQLLNAIPHSLTTIITIFTILYLTMKKKKKHF